MSDVLGVDAADLTKTYGPLTAVDRLSLQVEFDPTLLVDEVNALGTVDLGDARQLDPR